MPSVEREIRAELTAKAAEGAIKVFSSNLRQLLLQPPVKNQITLDSIRAMPMAVKRRLLTVRERFSILQLFILRSGKAKMKIPKQR